ncbi:DUF2690 domain-containing protein [Streptomyces sp. NPDC002809]|uniref:DUF2690 domain-containing protein n=1 Tax=Streptomyces sp. NPDC002809 TaxID=3154433 RepID=UPI0033337EFB
MPTTSAPLLPPGSRAAAPRARARTPRPWAAAANTPVRFSGATAGTSVMEVRHSSIRAAAWARITEASPGDSVEVSAGAAGQNGTADAAADACTPMAAVKRVADVRACALPSPARGCTAEAAG